MDITILGVGGFDNVGLPFNSFLVDGRLLVETPPDILQSLRREGVDPRSIEAVFVSHTHGDHVFGAPFLLFQLWRAREASAGPLRIIGPRDLRATILRLAALAIRDDHPYVRWIEESCSFQVAEAGSRLEVLGYEARFYKMFHEKETCGLGLSQGGRLRLQYLPDTRWDEGLKAYFAEGADLVLCDVNGTGGNREVHMSLEELESNLAGIIPEGTRILGTHLADAIASSSSLVGIAEPGQRLRLLDRTGEPRS